MAHISLVTLGVRDLKKATAFYEAMSWVRSTRSNDEITFMRGGTLVLGLYPRHHLAADVGIRDPGAVAFTGQTLATNVSSAEVVDLFLDSAKRAGGTVVKTGQLASWGGYSGYFADLDGYLWEVAFNPFFPLDQDGRIELDPGDGYVTPDQAQGQLAEFRATADDAGGRATEDLAADIVASLGSAEAGVAAILADESVNKVIAVMTALTTQAGDAEPGSARQMLLHAASTLVSGRITG